MKSRCGQMFQGAELLPGGGLEFHAVQQDNGPIVRIAGCQIMDPT